jgi:hypothetical protein
MKNKIRGITKARFTVQKDKYASSSQIHALLLLVFKQPKQSGLRQTSRRFCCFHDVVLFWRRGSASKFTPRHAS